MQKKAAAFMSVAEFKKMIGATNIEILVDKVSGKKSFTHNGQWYKVQSDIDTSKPLSFITECDENGVANWDNATLINIDNSKSKKDTLGII